MRTVAGWAMAALAGLVLLSACGGGDDIARGPFGQETATPEATAGVEEEEAPDLSDIGFVDNLLVKVEEGEWTLGEGLVATLKLFAGELDEAQVLRHTDLLFPEGTGTFEMAYEYLDDGPDEEAKAEINRLLDLLVFSNDQLEAMAGIGQPTAAHPGQLALGTARGQEEDCLKFFFGEKIEGVGQCLEVQLSDLLDDLYPGAYRVFRPAPSLPAAGWKDDHYELAMEAMEETVPIYVEMGKMPSVNIVFSVAGPGYATAFPEFGEACGVVLYTKLIGFEPGDFKQVVAHELAHCFQTETFPKQRVELSVRRWREEGLADYLSAVVYPKNNLEHRHLDRFAAMELSTTLVDTKRGYTTSLFFQYLYHQIGDDGILELVGRLPESGGKSEQAAKLAAAHPSMDKMYHDFTKALTDKTIADTGGPVPSLPTGIVPYEAPTKRVQISGKATPLLDLPLEPFAVSRHEIVVSDTKQAELAFKAKGEDRGSARPKTDFTEWTEVPSRLPGEECRPETILVVTNTKPDGGFKLDVPVVRDVSPGGLEGEWVVDNNSIEAHVRSRFPETRVDSISGEIRANFRKDGKVEVAYENFKVEGHSEGDSVLARTLGEPELYTAHTITTDARGTTSYKVLSLPPGDFIEFGSFFEMNYLEGTETVEYFQGRYELGFGGEPDAIPVGEVEETREEEPSGTDLFTALQEYDVQCQGTILRFLGASSGEVMAILHRAGPSD
jgi:hypothetical protein